MFVFGIAFLFSLVQHVECTRNGKLSHSRASSTAFSCNCSKLVNVRITDKGALKGSPFRKEGRVCDAGNGYLVVSEICSGQYSWDAYHLSADIDVWQLYEPKAWQSLLHRISGHQDCVARWIRCPEYNQQCRDLGSAREAKYHIFMDAYPFATGVSMAYHTEVSLCPVVGFKVNLTQPSSGKYTVLHIEGDERFKVSCWAFSYSSGGIRRDDKCDGIDDSKPWRTEFLNAWTPHIGMKRGWMKQKTTYYYGTWVGVPSDIKTRICADRNQAWSIDDYNVGTHNCYHFVNEVITRMLSESHPGTTPEFPNLLLNTLTLNYGKSFGKVGK
eukprot:TRINITY_DN4872_c0_g1_i1.p1 TRINITY_DN4872_c0_g1~~TRINITY_DN4872_c0_g1_i1.p1  ORF type:complete len:328 (-),score=-0.21 TRINITY_DN4872_c0_g1_i1:41-1024(-)